MRSLFLGIVGLLFWAFSGWQLIHAAWHGSIYSGTKGSMRYYSVDESLFYFLSALLLDFAILAFLTAAGILGIRQFLHERWLKQFRRDHSEPW